MNTIGLPELLIVLFVVLLVLGPKRLPGLGRSLGGGIREFKDSRRGRTSDRELASSTEPQPRSSGTDTKGLDGEVVPGPRR